jgi:predicted DNA-binding transcriptional regulator
MKNSLFNQRFTNFINSIDLAQKEFRVYQFLTKKPMTIKQLERNVRVSERMLRIYLDDLLRKHFISRRVIGEKRLKYVYTANPSVEILKMIKSKIASIERCIK